MDIAVILSAVVAAAAVSAAVTFALTASKRKRLEDELAARNSEMDSLKSSFDMERQSWQNRLEIESKSWKDRSELEAKAWQSKFDAEAESHRRIENEIRQSAEAALAEVKKTHAETLTNQIAALKSSMKAETDELLRKREEELTKKAQEAYSNITESLGKDIKNMKEAFESNKKTQTETSSAMKESIASAIKNLEESTKSIGHKADNLAEALRGQNKMQGCWGETILQKLFDNEGFIEGVNYDREVTLRDASGKALKNEDSGAKMRPDYIIHFPDKNDVVIDSKVSLVAFSDYIEASDEAARKDASARNVASIKEQVRKLAGKNYSDYLAPDHRMLDYTIMFIPNYSALQLAYMEDSNIWRDAFAKNVLITTEETLMPFLRMITIAWRNTEQVRNQEKIIEGATRMVSRVGDLVKNFEMLGRKLDDARTAYDKCNAKLKDSGQSIVKSAKDVVRLGVPESKDKAVSAIELVDNPADTI